MLAEGCIYGLCDPVDGQIRYIGQTVDLRRRLRTHLHVAITRRSPTHLGSWLRSLGEPPQVKVVEQGVEVADLDDRERYWIAELRGRGLQLVNATEGGGGVRSPTTRVRQKMGDANRGRRFSPKHRERLSAAQKRRFSHEPVSARTRRLQSEANIRLGLRPPSPAGRKASSEARANMSKAQRGRTKTARHRERLALASWRQRQEQLLEALADWPGIV